MNHYLKILRSGGVIACPTETLFALLADALNPRAVQRVCEIKRRRGQDPIAVLVPSIEVARSLASAFPEMALAMAQRYWPGPLTIVVKAAPGLPGPLVQNGKIGMRVPGPSPALDMVSQYGGALTATSANRTGEPAATSAEEASAAFGDELDGIVPGSCPGGPPSTLVEVSETRVRILRQGAIRIDV